MAHIYSYRETVKLLQDFLEVAFHTLLYIRQVYPSSLFSKAQKYNVEVWQSRNPALTEYIGGVLASVEEEMQKGAVRRVVVVIKEDTLEAKPLERFVFDFEWLIKSKDVPKPGDDFTPKKLGLAQGDVEDLLRACFLKLNTSQAGLKPLPPKTTWAVVLELKDDADPPESTAARQGRVPAEWIPAEQRYSSEENGEGAGRGRAENEGMSTISPLEHVRLGMISMDLRVEEMAAKFEDDEFLSSGETGGVEIHQLPSRKGKERAY